MDVYPATAAARDRFVLDRRVPRAHHDPWRYQDLVLEDERTHDGRIARGATVFLTGRECPWRCVMCDLWQSTITSDTPAGAIPAQVAAARREIDRRSEPVTQVKLYNAGSFFDPRAVPESDYADVAAELGGLERVIVESHPALVGPRVNRFLDGLDGLRGPGHGPVGLEVAMGLETAHPQALERLHKQMSVEDFGRAAEALERLGVSLRVFLLIAPPFVPHAEQDDWLLASIGVAFSCGASVVSLIPTRPGNGALEALAADGCFRPPRLEDVERSVSAGLAHIDERGRRIDQRVFVDVWDLDRLADCPSCFNARRARLHAMNLEQRVLPEIFCPQCGTGAQP